MLFANSDTQRARQAACESCDQRVKMVFLVCKACGCHLPSKIAMAGADCPLGKWTFPSLEEPGEKAAR